MRRFGYMMIKEAAVKYGVSRAKLHRLVKTGRLQTVKDPLDERASLLREEDLEALFRFPGEEGPETAPRDETGATNGIVTAEMAARMDAARARTAEGRGSRADSVQMVREERERRARGLEGDAGNGGPTA